MRPVSADSKSGPEDREPGFDVLDLTDVTPVEDVARAIAAAHQLASSQSSKAQIMAPATADLVARHRQTQVSAGRHAAPLVDPGDLWPLEATAPPAAPAPAPERERERLVTLDWVAERASEPGNDLGGAAGSLAPPGPPAAVDHDARADPRGLAGPASHPTAPELHGGEASAPPRHPSVEAELAKRLRKPTVQGPPTGVPFNDRATLGLQGVEPTDSFVRAETPARLARRGPHAPVAGLPDDAGPLPHRPDATLEPRSAPTATTTARVRSQRLHHVRSASAARRQQQPEPHVTHIRPRPQAPTVIAGPWYRRMLLLVLLVLLDAALLPSARDGGLVPPWLALASPGSPTFIAATFLIIVAAVAFIPMPARVRAAAGAALGLALTAFGLALLSGAVGAGAFDGQPALAAFVDAGGAARWVLVLAAATLPAALFWRRHHPGGVGARILLGTGLVFVAFVYLAGQHVGLGDSMPLTALTRAGRTSPFLGDRVAAWLSLAPFVLMPAALVTLTEAGRRGAAILGALFWLSVALPLVALAAFVAPASAFADTFAPLQVVAVLAAGLLLLPAGLGALLTSTLSDGQADG